MVEANDIRELVRYNRRVADAYERALGRLGWRAISRDRGAGLGSLKDTYIHLVQVADGWLNYVVTGRVAQLSARPDPFMFRDFGSIRKWSRAVWSEIEGSAARLTDADLRRRVKAPWMPGEYTLADAYFQVTFEQAHHLGEMIAMFWQMDRAPPEMTWIVTRRRIHRAKA